jgi:hypothetical protein
MRQFSGILTLTVLAALSGGCVGMGDTLRVDAYVKTEIAGDTFNACLARGYQSRAYSEVTQDGNYSDAARFVRRSEAAAAGQNVEPWAVANEGVDPKDAHALDAARARLIAALANKDRNACDCANAQVRFDGWLEQASDNKLGAKGYGPTQPEFVNVEKTGFARSVAKCEGAAAKEAKNGIDISAK